MLYRNKFNLVIDGPRVRAQPGQVGIELENCPGALLINFHVRGGRTCVQAANCPGIVIKLGDVGGFANTPEEEGHGIQLRHCDFAKILRLNVHRSRAGEDGINIFQSANVEVATCTIDGHGRARSGNGITIDNGSNRARILINRLVRQGQRAIVAADGKGHIIELNEAEGVGDDLIAIENSYDRKTRAVLVRRNQLHGKNVYVDPRTTESVTVE